MFHIEVSAKTGERVDDIFSQLS